MIVFLLPEADLRGGTYNKCLGLVNNTNHNSRILIYSKTSTSHKNQFVDHTEKKGFINNLFCINKYIKKNEVKLVICHFFRCQIFAFLLKMLNPNLKIIRAYVGVTDLTSTKKIIENFTSSFFDRFIFVSHFVKKIRKPLFANKKKIHVIPNGTLIDTDGRNHKRKKHLKLLCIKGLTKDMEIEKLINCVGKYSENLNITLDIIGDGPYRKELEEKVTKLKASRIINFLGYVANASKHIKNYDIYVHPTSREGFGIAILEAMNAGVPIIVPKKGGASEIIENDTQGLQINFNSRKEWTAAIEQLKKHRIRNSMAHNAKILLKNRYSIDSMTTNYEEVINGILKKE